MTYHNVPAVGDEVPDLCDPELLDLGGKGQVVAEVDNLVLQQEVQSLEELVVLALHVLNQTD